MDSLPLSHQEAFFKSVNVKSITSFLSWCEKQSSKFKFVNALKKQESSRKNIYFCFIDYAKAFDCVGHNKLWTILEEMGIPDHLTWLLKNLYAGHEAAVRTGHGTADCFQIGKGVYQDCIIPTLLI